MAQAQKVKVEWVSGDVTVYKKGTTATVKVKKNETLDATDRLFLGDKALLVVSDYSNKLFEVKKKGYITGKELSEGLVKTADSEYQRYLAYILKELKTHEGDMKSNEKGIPGAPSRGDDFMITMPDTIRVFNSEQLPIRWISSINTEMVNIQLQTDKNVLLDLDVNGDPQLSITLKGDDTAGYTITGVSEFVLDVDGDVIAVDSMKLHTGQHVAASALTT